MSGPVFFRRFRTLPKYGFGHIGPMEKVRVSMVCMNSRIGDYGGNLAKHLEYVSRAVGAGTDVLCFPELSLSGYAMPESSRCAVPLGSDYVSELVSSTADNGMTVCFGVAEEGEFISHVIAEGGKIAGVYRKTHLGFREAKVMNRGSALPVFETRKAKIGIQLCWEAHIPEISATYALKGADIILMPHASGLDPGRRKEGWDKIVPARAYDNTVFCATCNQTGDNGSGTVFGGGSVITDPRGNIVSENYSGECMNTAELDGRILETIRSSDGSSMKNLYFLNGRRQELYFR